MGQNLISTHLMNGYAPLNFVISSEYQHFKDLHKTSSVKIGAIKYVHCKK